MSYLKRWPIALVFIVLMLTVVYIATKALNEHNNKETIIFDKPNKVTKENAKLTNSSIDSAINSSSTIIQSKPQFIEKQVPVTELDGTFAQHLDKLMAQYKAGDLEAGYVIAVNLDKCFSAPVTVDEFIESKNYRYKENAATKLGDVNSAIFSLEQRFDYCFGVAKEQRALYFEYLTEVAAKGYPPAQMMYSLISPQIFLPRQFEQLSSAEQQHHIKQYRTQANVYLAEAAKSGSLFAMFHLMGEYRFSQHTPRDPIMALAYNLALLDLTEHDVIYQQLTQVRGEIEEKMSYQQIQDAMSKSQLIVDEVYKNGQLYRF